MTIALEYSQISLAPFARLSRALGDMRDKITELQAIRRQKAILLSIDPETLGDIGFSADYVRAEWQSFAADHPALVPPAACARNARVSC